MPDWTRSMQQTFEFHIVDPVTWKNKKRLTEVVSSKIDYDSGNELIGTQSLECHEALSEEYVRTTLVCTQDGVSESFVLGTFLVQSPKKKFDGHFDSHDIQAYSALIELRDSRPPLGFAILRNENVMDRVTELTQENVRVPVVPALNNTRMHDDFVSDFDNDTWLTFLKELMGNAKFHFSLDETGRILFAPDQRLEAMRPVWTFNDDNSSILMPEITIERDLYGIPNVVEILSSNENGYRFSRVENRDDNSPLSIQNRGREIIYRETDPPNYKYPTQEELDIYAQNVLEAKSTYEFSLSYTHGYCPVRIGDCVRLNYTRAGLTDIKALVVSQSIDCRPGCLVTEKAVFTTKLWEG